MNENFINLVFFVVVVDNNCGSFNSKLKAPSSLPPHDKKNKEKVNFGITEWMTNS